MSEAMLKGKVIEELTAIVERAEHRAIAFMPKPQPVANTSDILIAPMIDEDEKYFLGAA